MDLTLTVHIGDLADGADPELVRADVERVIRQDMPGGTQWTGDQPFTTLTVDRADDQQLVITGSPTDGFNYYGPFATSEEAYDAVQNSPLDGFDWWVTDLQSPTNLTDPNADGTSDGDTG